MHGTQVKSESNLAREGYSAKKTVWGSKAAFKNNLARCQISNSIIQRFCVKCVLLMCSNLSVETLMNQKYWETLPLDVANGRDVGHETF